MKVPLVRNIWTEFGLNSNPFDTSPISLTAPNVIHHLCVGRQETKEAMLMTNILRSSGGARVVVEGEIGVGKTTFLNYHRFIWFTEAQDKLFTSIQEICVLPDWNLQDFLLNIFGALINRLLVEKGEGFIGSKPLLREIAILTKVYCHSQMDVQGQLFGFGLGIGKSEQITVPKVPDFQLLCYFRQLVGEIKNLGYDGVFLHFDNLELVASRNPDRIRKLFDEIRDALQVPDVYYVFVGNLGFYSEIINPLERVRSIFFGSPIQVPPLSEDEVVEAINRRYQVLATGKSLAKPFADEFIRYLYRLYHGKIRFIMDSLYNVVLRTIGTTPAPLAESKAREMLREIVVEKVNATLTPKEKQVLMTAVKYGTFVNSVIAKRLNMPMPNVARCLERLTELNFIYPLQKVERYRYYRVNETVQILRESELDMSPEQPAKPEMTGRQQRILQILSERSPVTSKELLTYIGCSLPTLRRDLNELIRKRLVTKHGSTRSAAYEINKR